MTSNQRCRATYPEFTSMLPHPDLDGWVAFDGEWEIASVGSWRWELEHLHQLCQGARTGILPTLGQIEPSRTSRLGGSSCEAKREPRLPE